ncbi:hypothetical protein [Streptomyces sp. NBC_00459]|uniref:hypothetical protein n=1 Tax=Streptomyces sp. NBC_00459 TaxID=2975749 RepID=UPI002E17F8F4
MTTITRAATAAAICAAVLLTGTACTSGDDGPTTSAKKSAPPTPTASAEPAADANADADAVEDVDGESVTEAPQIERKTIASFANGQFGRVIPLKGGLHKGTLGIALNCEGKGTAKVEVPALGVTFKQECADGKVASIYNEIEVSAAARHAYAQVTGTSGVRWSVSAGQ